MLLAGGEFALESKRLGVLLATNQEHKQEVSESYPKQENE
jgi:hypothetical protein